VGAVAQDPADHFGCDTGGEAREDVAAGLALEVDLLGAPFLLHPAPRFLVEQQCDLDRRACFAAQDASRRPSVLGHAECRGDGVGLAEQRGRFDAVDLEVDDLLAHVVVGGDVP